MIFRTQESKNKILLWFKDFECEEMGENGYLRNGVKIKDKNNYKYVLNSTNVEKHSMPSKFDKSNPFSFDNIKKYIIDNGYKVDCLSGYYNGVCSSFLWRCSCGERFEDNFCAFMKYKENFKCPICREKEKIQKFNSCALRNINDNGYILFDWDITKNKIVSTSRINIVDSEGYKYNIPYRSFTSHKRKPDKFHTANPFTIDNINNLLLKTKRNDYECIDKNYYGNNKKICILHKRCNKIYKTDLVNIQNGQICPYCFGGRHESLHASVLKQVFIHEYSDTILEETSCINKKTGYPLPTDIVNNKLKIAIEIQSQFHDREEQKIKDMVKKEFWKNKGYVFYDPDIRDYTILQLVQMFFPYMKEIPEYIIWNFSQYIDINYIQNEINNGKSIKQIASETGISHSTILGAVRNKKIVLPKKYFITHLNRKGILMLDDNKNIIQEFSTFKEAEEAGYKAGTIYRVLNGKQNKSYGKYWMYKTDYQKLQLT